MFTQQANSIQSSLSRAGMPASAVQDLAGAMCNCVQPIQHRGPVSFAFDNPWTGYFPGISPPPGVTPPYAGNLPRGMSPGFQQQNVFNFPEFQPLTWDNIPFLPQAPFNFSYNGGNTSFQGGGFAWNNLFQPASFQAVLQGGAVSNVNVLYGGFGYTAPPALSFSGGGGSGAVAVPVVQNGSVVSVNLSNGGSGYTQAPAVSAGGGAPAATQGWVNANYYSGDPVSWTPQPALSVDGGIRSGESVYAPTMQSESTVTHNHHNYGDTYNDGDTHIAGDTYHQQTVTNEGDTFVVNLDVNNQTTHQGPVNHQHNVHNEGPTHHYGPVAFFGPVIVDGQRQQPIMATVLKDVELRIDPVNPCGLQLVRTFGFMAVLGEAAGFEFPGAPVLADRQTQVVTDVEWDDVTKTFNKTTRTITVFGCNMPAEAEAAVFRTRGADFNPETCEIDENDPGAQYNPIHPS